MIVRGNIPGTIMLIWYGYLIISLSRADSLSIGLIIMWLLQVAVRPVTSGILGIGRSVTCYWMLAANMVMLTLAGTPFLLSFLFDSCSQVSHSSTWISDDCRMIHI